MDDEKASHKEDGASVPESPAIQPQKAVDEAGLESSSTEAPEQAPEKTATETQQQEVWITGLKLGVIVAAISMAAFLMLLDVSIVATAIPRITSDFHSLTDIGWYGSAYLLANCSLQPMAGKIYGRFDSKVCFMVFFGLFEFGSLLSAVATSSKMFIVGRAVAGMGGSGVVNGGLTIIAKCVPMQKRGLYIGMIMGVAQLGIMLGPLVGGALTEYASWRWCFYINLPAGAFVAVFLFFIRIPSHSKSSEKVTFLSITKSLDVLGFVLFAPAAIMFLLALEWGGNVYRWDSSTVIGLFCGAFGTIVVFFVWESRVGDEAMIPLSMITKRIIASSCLAMLFSAACMIVTSFYMAIYFQADKGVSPMLSGVYLLPSILTQIMFGLFSGGLVGRVGYYLPFIIAGTTFTSIGTGLLSTLVSTSSTGRWIGFQIIAGVGRGLTLQMPILAIQNNLEPRDIPVGMSLLMFSQNMGAALFVSFAQTILSTTLVHELPILAPGINTEAVIAAGASSFREVVPKALLRGVLLAYDQAIHRVFYLAAGSAAAGFVACWGMGWKSVKKPKVQQPEA
ncbi:MFS general substrate transporter [Hyaloscypha variabilis]|uniref:MFS general substrate transporter n=1 Tax=Hyaloscypha variabilis (strain UAMH 11265 / GT02V1 / F) TaxID=1149755 RepID=A0A2J6S5Q9_HYAVF|nr:MFS general substrate transporter [Hyaloscypha variabilis F]